MSDRFFPGAGNDEGARRDARAAIVDAINNNPIYPKEFAGRTKRISSNDFGSHRVKGAAAKPLNGEDK